MESRKHREFKLATPLQFAIRNSEIIIKDKFENTNTILIDTSVVFNVSNPDNEGYVLFNVSYLEPKKPRQITIFAQTEAHMNGYIRFHTNLSNSFGFGGQKSLFEYYKRDSDLSYYALIKTEGKKDRKIQLGSLSEPSSRIFQVACIINERFLRGKIFDKHDLAQYLPRPLNGARIIKGSLDILAKEGYLTSDTAKSGKRNRNKEIFIKTEKLEKHMTDPRSWQKPNGLNIGSVTATSDQ